MQDYSTSINMFNCPVPVSISVAENYSLIVSFNNGITKKFNFAPYFKYKVFEPLKDIKLFKKAYVIPSAIVWNEDLDIAIEEVYEKGVTIANNT